MPFITETFENISNTELLRQTAVAMLTNMAVTTIYHELYYTPRLIESLLAELDRGSDRLKLLSLKLLVNLSCNDLMVPYILAAQVHPSLYSALYLLTPSE